MRTGVTLEDVTRAADELLTGGERPTVEAVRGVLGTGAPATVNRLLKDYYQALSSRLTLPPPIASAAAALTDTIRRTVSIEAQARETEHRVQLERERQQLVVERQAFEAERTQLRDRVAALGSDLQQLSETRTRLDRRVEDLAQNLTEQTRRTAAAESRADAAVDERTRLEERHRLELQDLHTRWEGNERHFLVQIDEARTQLKRLQAERDKEAATASKRIAELESRVATLTAEGADLRANLSHRDAQLDGERGARTELEARMSQLTRQHEQESERLTAERDAIRAELQRERARHDELTQAHQQAIHEAALNEGKAQALRGQLDEFRRHRDPRSSSIPQKAQTGES